MLNLKYPQAEKNSLRAMAQEVRTQLTGGMASYECSYPLRQIEQELVDTYKALQKIEDDEREAKLEKISPDRLQTFNCIKLRDTEDFSCKCSGADWGLKKAEIPDFLEYKGSPYITHVGVMDKAGSVSFVPVASVRQMQDMSEIIKSPLYITMSKSLYVFLPKDYVHICEISVTGSPKVATATSGACFDVWSGAFNISDYMRKHVKDEVIRTMGSNFVRTGQGRDLINQGTDGNTVAE